MTRRVAVLGAGVGAEHITGYLTQPQRFHVAYVCDLNSDRAREQASRCGAQAVPDIALVLTDPSVDVIDICLPPRLHVQTACAALKAGKHVIVEKPLAGTNAEASRVAEQARECGRRVFPVFQYRYGRAFAQLDGLVAAGLTGRPEVAALETHWNRGGDYYAAPWRGSRAHELGGAVLSHAIHAHDLLTRYFGPVAEVSAMLDTRINPIETEDCAAITLRLSNGALATSSITLGAATDTSRLRFVFRDLTAESGDMPYAPGQGHWRFIARDPKNQPKVDRVVAATPAGPEGFAGFLAAVGAALDGHNGAVTLEEGMAAVALANAIYQAASSGSCVRLPSDLGVNHETRQRV